MSRTFCGPSLLRFSPIIEDEENLPSLGQKHPRADLGIPALGLIIEVKFVRDGSPSEFARIIGEIAEDAGRYLSTKSACTEIVAFVWDDSARGEQHTELRQGLEKIKGVVGAVVLSRPGKMRRPVTADTSVVELPQNKAKSPKTGLVFGAIKILFGAPRNAGIIDQHIELAEMPGGGGHDGGPALLFGHIKRFEPRRGADGIGHLPAFVFQHVGDDHPGPFARENPRRGRAHAGCRAGDDGDLVRESHGCLPFASSADYLTTALLTEREGSNAGPRSP
jgi:hypothetical protein